MGLRAERTWEVRHSHNPGGLTTLAGQRNGRSRVGMSLPKAAGTQLASFRARACLILMV